MKKLLFFIGILGCLASCQHSDICTENEPSTPKVLIKFYNIDKPTKLKKVEDFNAKEINSEEYYFENPKTDTLIKLPLKTNEQTTAYRLVILQDSIQEKSDILEFNYTNEEVYISRACGFKNGFHEISTELIENDTWIKNVEIRQENIIDEKQTHIYIYH